MDDELDGVLIGLLACIADGARPLAAREDAFRRLYELTSRRLYGVALRVAGNREWAEDILQEAYLNVWRIAANYRQSLSPPLAWLGVIVRSRALDFLRRRQAERLDTAQPLEGALSDTLPDGGESPMDTAQASEQAWALHECLRKLEARQREVLSLAYLRDLSHGELAAQLKLPLGTVKTWIRRGIEQLRGCMARYA
ncbi:RNA polymerase sigma factor [Ramlibacter sp. PS4R-6]|uniref:RNA polymerase sigma factor n=1 Tax=Ramlibacter sp. PS4R-6 TaxID=3133438 RepID=UPI0030A7927D